MKTLRNPLFMLTSTKTKLHRRLRKTFLGSLLFTLAVLIGFSDHSSGGEYSNNSIIKAAHADSPGGGGGGGGDGCGCGGGCGQGCGAGSGSSGCSASGGTGGPGGY